MTLKTDSLPPAPQGGSDPSGAVTNLRRAVNWRSILLGLVGVLLICGLTPYNDYVMTNTYLVGNFLPVGLVLFFFVFCTMFNSLVWRISPRQALTGAELAVAMGMALVSCCMPSSGLMRYLPTHLVGLYQHASSGGDAVTVIKEAKIPTWALPSFGYTFESTGDENTAKGQWVAPTTAPSMEPTSLANDQIIQYFWGRIPQQQVGKGFMNRLEATPWAAWAKPALSWGLFTAAFLGAVLAMMVIVRHQWVENERLPFPLASIYASLIESPAPGKSLNPLFRSPGFWISFGVVFAIHSTNALALYYPNIWPKIPIRYELWSLFADAPLSAMDFGIKTAGIYFCIVGITYFLQSNVAFSLWFSFIMVQLTRVILSGFSAELTPDMQTDQLFGALIPFALTTIWIGRAHWKMVFRQMLRGAAEGEARGRYLSYPFAGWMMLGCMVGMCIWLMAAGMTMINAIGLILMMLTLCLVIARVVAETGLVFVQIPVPTQHPWVVLMQSGVLPAAADPAASVPSYYMIASIGKVFTSDMRESLPVFSSHALRLADYSRESGNSGVRKQGRSYGFIGALVLALLIGFLVAGASTLFVEYSYANTLDKQPASPLNGYGISQVPTDIITLVTQMKNTGGPPVVHNRYVHIALGAIITTTLAVLRLRYVSWPLHPVGFLLCYSYPIMFCWFSIFLGWLLKALIVKFGGSSLYRQAKPWFLGMIVGEASVAGFWLVISLLLNSRGMPYEAIRLLPG